MRPFIPAQPDIIEQGVREMVHPFRSTSQLTTPTIVRFSPRLLLGAATIGLGALLFTFGAGTAQADTSGLTSHTNAPTSSSPVGGIAGALDGTVKTVAGALHGTTKTLAADLNGTTKTVAADLNGTGNDTSVAIMAPEYWPLPWYLRDYKNTGYFGKAMQTNAAIVIASVRQLPELVPLLADRYRLIGTYPLRPGVQLVVYVAYGRIM